MRYSYIIFYHRVLPQHLKKFTTQIKILKKLSKIVDISEIENLKHNSLIITFDDGFYDNYVFAYPILKKFNIPATIFISTAKITDNPPRKNLFDWWSGKVSFKELIDNSEEFLSWEEIKIMNKSGLINIQAHSHNHYSHFTSYYFIKEPQRKRKALNIKWDNEKLYKIESFLKNFEYIPEDMRFENHIEREKRITPEFIKPKELIKKYLGYYPEHFCWPWGEYDNFSLEIGKKHGYKYFYTTEKGLICDKINFEKIPRISSSFNYFKFLKRNMIYPNNLFAKILRLC